MIDANWQTDPVLFAGLQGGREVIHWFGFVPGFHDANLRITEWCAPRVALELDAFVTTDRVDDEGYFEHDRHATVGLICWDITGVRPVGVEPAIVCLLRIREVAQEHIDSDPDIAEIRHTCGGPEVGDYQIDVESSYGLSAAIFAKQIELTLAVPVPPPRD